MKSDARLGVVMTLVGGGLLFGGPALGAPWPLGLIFVSIGVLDFVRAWRGRNTSDRERRIIAVMDQAFTLRRTDPAAADRILDDLFLSEGERDAAELASLEQAAFSDPSAVGELQRRLEALLRVRAAAKRHFEKHMAGDHRLPQVLHSLEAAEAATRGLLARMEAQAPRLKP